VILLIVAALSLAISVLLLTVQVDRLTAERDALRAEQAAIRAEANAAIRAAALDRIRQSVSRPVSWSAPGSSARN
jgi:hypothetical protein